MEKHFKQLIIARRDLNMSPGKLAAQVSHASSAFLIEMIRDSWPGKAQGFYQVNYRLDEDIYDNWINDGVTKVVCGARNRGRLEKAIEKAKELGMIEGVDYFPIVDVCRTELTPESPQGTLTCVGFRPMEAEKIDEIGKDFHLLLMIRFVETENGYPFYCRIKNNYVRTILTTNTTIYA